MPNRYNYPKLAMPSYQALLAVERTINEGGLEVGLVHLLKLRCSQLNGCAFCIDMHWKDLRAHGETEPRLYMLDAWHESPGYSERERAALAWAEAVTNLHDGHVSDAAYAAVRTQFDEAEVAKLTFVVAAINAWNRLAIAARTEPGHYQPRKAE